MEQFLGWFDDTPKKSVQTKIDEAVERFTYKFGYPPDVCLVNERDLIEYTGVTLRAGRSMRPNYFWIGREEMGGLGQPATSDAPARPAAPVLGRRRTGTRAKVEQPAVSEVPLAAVTPEEIEAPPAEVATLARSRSRRAASPVALVAPVAEVDVAPPEAAEAPLAEVVATPARSRSRRVAVPPVALVAPVAEVGVALPSEAEAPITVLEPPVEVALPVTSRSRRAAPAVALVPPVAEVVTPAPPTVRRRATTLPQPVAEVPTVAAAEPPARRRKAAPPVPETVQPIVADVPEAPAPARRPRRGAAAASAPPPTMLQASFADMTDTMLAETVQEARPRRKRAEKLAATG